MLRGLSTRDDDAKAPEHWRSPKPRGKGSRRVRAAKAQSIVHQGNIPSLRYIIMELTITSIAVGAALLVLFGFLLGCGYYSWENHYRFKKQGSSEIEIGMRFGTAASPQFEFFGLTTINDLLTKGGRIVAVREGAVLTRKSGNDGDNVVMQWTGFSVKFDVAQK